MTDKIIIADDKAIIRKPLEQLLGARYDLEIHTVLDGEPLVERVRDNGYSVVLTDNQMLRLSGLDATKQIREFNPDVPIIMLSASDIEEEALEAGVTHFIRKEYIGDELYPILDAYLTKRT